MVLGPSGDGDTDMPLQRATATYTCKVPAACMHAGLQIYHSAVCMSDPRRAECVVWARQDERFRLEKRTYDNQYAQLYFCRLLAMAPKLRARVEQAWPGVPGAPRRGRNHDCQSVYNGAGLVHSSSMLKVRKVPSWQRTTQEC